MTLRASANGTGRVRKGVKGPANPSGGGGAPAAPALKFNVATNSMYYIFFLR